MKVEHFLEKNEVREITIFKQLVLNNGILSYGKMLDHLAVSKASLENDLESITSRIEVFNDQVQVDYDGQEIKLTMSDHISLQHIYRIYLDQSIKMEIINYLFKHQEFSITQLTQQLAISDSSLFRKIKELNTHLKEFGLKIRNGQLQGEELQIRYFYFQFYYYIEDKSALIHLRSDQQITQAVQSVENFLQVNIVPENRQRLNIWLIISKSRITNKNKNYKQLRKQMHPYLKDPLYHKIHVMVLRYYSRYSIEVDEEEAMLHFAFLLAFPILTEHDFHEYTLIRDRHAPIASLDTYIVETIIIHFKFRKLPYMLERDMYYHLTHIHTRLYFFQGDIEIYEYEEMLAREKQVVGKNLVPLARTLLTTSTDKFMSTEVGDNSLLKMELLKYISLLTLISFKMATVIQIGIDLKMDGLYKDTLSQLLILKMRPINGIQIEVYQPSKSYDLILTNEKPDEEHQYQEARVYILSEILSSFDMANIQRIIQELNA
ncbi:helix-turn-helix domain-containing protein [Marinilactibacillus sp. XAAS-LB27]|uniref:helix-turn-helix domain-containing protein n=1 Tax=Marinilactibacillus sp. XAAS-LB27 TaxID=3114538 RepID=UPI002E176414|nr:helix-turn-helix domain-containing protein [Marinilactibacillus sp. XAAS-LB27]